MRREILQLLRKKAMSAGEIAEHFTLSKPTLSGHFSVLKAADLVTTERQGTTIIYRLNMSTLEEAIGALMDIAQLNKKGAAKWLFARS